MEQIKDLLEARGNQLQQLKHEKEKASAKAPEGSLRLCKHGNRTQYYHRNNPQDFNGIYIKEKDMGLARKLAQKDYDKKVLCSVEKELNAISKYLSELYTLKGERVRSKSELIIVDMFCYSHSKVAIGFGLMS